MDKRTRKLRQRFPGTDSETRLVILGPTQRLKIGDKPLLLQEHPVGNNEYIYAAYSEETNTIYIRFTEK